jgi:hypothetical protein
VTPVLPTKRIAHLGMAGDNPPGVRYESLADAGSFANPIGFPVF